MPRCLLQHPTGVNYYQCDHPLGCIYLVELSQGHRCRDCRSVYCDTHRDSLLYRAEQQESEDEEEEEQKQEDEEYAHWDENHPENELKIPKGCVTCTRHPRYIKKRVFRDDEVMSFLLKHARIKDYNEAIKFLRMELSQTIKDEIRERLKEKERNNRDEHDSSTDTPQPPQAAAPSLSDVVKFNTLCFQDYHHNEIGPWGKPIYEHSQRIRQQQQQQENKEEEEVAKEPA